MSDDPQIPLAAAIEELRAELLRALNMGKDQPLQFRVKPVELEMNLSVTRDASASGGVKFWVASVDAAASQERAVSHKIKLVLEPVSEDGQSEFLISRTGQVRPT
ncbi:MAG: trypco2 family protein [Pseudomonadota bacterium]